MEDEVREDGTLVPQNLTIWVDEIFAGIIELTPCQFIGTVDINKDGNAVMNAIRVQQIGSAPPESVDTEEEKDFD